MGLADTLIIIAFIGSCYIWSKEKSKLSFYFFLTLAAAIGLNIWEYLSKNILNLSYGMQKINNDVVFMIWIALIIVWGVIVFKVFTRK